MGTCGGSEAHEWAALRGGESTGGWWGREMKIKEANQERVMQGLARQTEESGSRSEGIRE